MVTWPWTKNRTLLVCSNKHRSFHLSVITEVCSFCTSLFGRPFVKRFTLCCQTVVCPVCVWDVGAVWPNSCMDEDETWHAGRPQPRTRCVRWGLSSPSPKGAQPPNFRPISVVAKWLDGSTCHLVCLRPGDFVLDGDAAPCPKRGGVSPNFRSTFIMAKRLHGSRFHLVRRYASTYTTLCSMCTQLSREKGHTPTHPVFVYCGHGLPSQLLLGSCSKWRLPPSWFLKLELLTMGTVQKIKLHHYSRFCGNWSNLSWDRPMAIFRLFFKMAAVRHLEFVMSMSETPMKSIWWYLSFGKISLESMQ